MSDFNVFGSGVFQGGSNYNDLTFTSVEVVPQGIGRIVGGPLFDTLTFATGHAVDIRNDSAPDTLLVTIGAARSIVSKYDSIILDDHANTVTIHDIVSRIEIHGGAAADNLAGSGNVALFGGYGDDVLTWVSKPDVGVEATIRGGPGYDTLVLSGLRSSYAFALAGDDLVISHGLSSVRAGEIDVVRFADGETSWAALLSVVTGVPQPVEPGFNPLAYIASYADLRAAFGTNTDAATEHYRTLGRGEGRTVTFDPAQYVAANVDIARAFGTDFEAASRHFITLGANEGRSVTFDALRYLASNVDLISAFGTDAGAATRHFITFGAQEGRTMAFDAMRYLAANADLVSAFGTDTQAATRHYVEFGAREGRAVTFDALGYTASNVDLIAAFGVDTQAAVRHYVEFGVREGRAVSFDALRYIASNEDLISAFGTDTQAATRHYIEFGAVEGRGMGFDPLAYAGRYPDLAQAFGNDTDALARHYIEFGAAEGRSATPDLDAASNVLSVGDITLAAMDVLHFHADTDASAATVPGPAHADGGSVEGFLAVGAAAFAIHDDPVAYIALAEPVQQIGDPSIVIV